MKQKPRWNFWRALGCAVGLAVLFTGLFVLVAAAIFGFSLANSHIKANVPPSDQFDAITTRDFQAYFQQQTGKPVQVTWELLRKGPTQTGVALPKFYFWVQIYTGDTLIDEGAVRAAAVEQTHMDITHYVSKAEIQANPDRIYLIFPKPVCEKIFARAGVIATPLP